MGIGDEIMVTGRVRAMVAAARRPIKVAVLDKRKLNVQRWQDIWRGNPHMAEPGERYDDHIFDHGGERPYIIDLIGGIRWRFRPYGPKPGAIYGLETYQDFADAAKGRVIVNPDLKASASVNKAWPMEFWRRLVTEYPEVPWLQIGPPNIPRRLPVPYLQTPDFRAATAALRGATASVLQEGGLHHAAAAMDRPAVVLFGGFISPRCTGYDMHRNLFHETKEHPLGCGNRRYCLHCEQAMRNFTPLRVYNELEKIL